MYKTTDSHSQIADDMVGFVSDVGEHFPNMHHVRLELTFFVETVIGHPTPGRGPEDLHFPAVIGDAYVEDEDAGILMTKSMAYSSDEVEGLILHSCRVLHDPRTKLLLQLVPRLVFVLEPSDTFPMRAEISCHNLHVEVLAKELTDRKSLMNWLFTGSRFGQRITVYLTPDRNPDRPTRPRRRRHTLRHSPRMLDDTDKLAFVLSDTEREEDTLVIPQGPVATVRDNDAFHPEKVSHPDQVWSNPGPQSEEERNRVARLIAEAEESVNDASEIPVLRDEPMYSRFGEIMPTKEDIDEERKRSMNAGREFMLQKMELMKKAANAKEPIEWEGLTEVVPETDQKTSEGKSDDSEPGIYSVSDSVSSEKDMPQGVPTPQDDPMNVDEQTLQNLFGSSRVEE